MLFITTTTNKDSRKPSVSRVFFESKAEQSKLLVGDRVEESMDDVICEAAFLILVHLYHLRANTSTLTTCLCCL